MRQDLIRVQVQAVPGAESQKYGAWDRDNASG